MTGFSATKHGDSFACVPSSNRNRLLRTFGVRDRQPLLPFASTERRFSCVVHIESSIHSRWAWRREAQSGQTANQHMLEVARDIATGCGRRRRVHLCRASWINPATDPPQLATIDTDHLSHWRNPAYLGSLLSFSWDQGGGLQEKEGNR